MKVLLAIDGSPHSDAAATEVGRRPWPPQTEVRVITVDPPLDGDLLRSGAPTAFDELVRQQRHEAEKHLAQQLTRLRNAAPTLQVTGFLREGFPKEVILDEADQWGADLIVVGSHGKGAIRRLFLGSVSLAVATNALCSVEIVRLPAG